MNATICILAKEPRAGAVKTRLAATIGHDAAARLAGAFLADTVALAARTPARVVIALEGDASALPQITRGAEVWPQGDGDLGARLERALRRALAHSRHAVAIGADSPGLPVARLRTALTMLEHHDAVIGPAYDGGFYLLGLTTCPPGLLADLPWSAADTRQRTRARLGAHGLRVAELTPWFDVDVASDLERLRSLLAAGFVQAPATAALLGLRRAETSS